MVSKVSSEDGIISVSEMELAEYLSVSDRRIRQLHKDGVVFKLSRGQYDLKRSVKGYVDFLKKEKDTNIEKLKIAKEAEVLTHERLRKRKTELIVQQMESKLHKEEDVEYYWNVGVQQAKSKLLSLPTKISPMLLGITEQREIQAILRSEISQALNELAEYDVTKFQTEFTGFEDEDEDYEED